MKIYGDWDIMIVNHKHKFAFTHIPKCGGTSITEYLHSIPGTKTECPTPGWVHGSVANMENTWNYFNFATIRNPLDWYVSMYNHCKRHYSTSGPQECFIFGDVRETPFHEWVMNALHPHESIGKSDVWNSEIGYSESKDDIINQKLKVGWYTLKVLYGASRNYRKHFDTDIYTLRKSNMKEIFDVDLFLNLDTMEDHLPKCLSSMSTARDHMNGLTFKKHRLGTHEKSTEKNYTPDLVFHVMNNDMLIVDLVKKGDAIWLM